jgi:hypothetical protein
MAAELDQPGLVRIKRQRKLAQSLAHRLQEAPGVVLALEPNDDIVGVAHDDHVARGLVPSPALGPEIVGVVQVDVGQERRDRRPLPRPPVADRHDPVFQNARLKPLPDQADDARIADPVLDEANQPVLADFVEERPDVGVQYEVHFPAGDPDGQCVERVLRSASGPESVREPEEVLLVDRVQHCDCRSLDDLVFESGDRERPLSAIRPRIQVRGSPAGQRPIRSPMEPCVQIREVARAVRVVLLPCQAIHARRGVRLEFVERVLEQVDGEARSHLTLLPAARQPIP